MVKLTLQALERAIANDELVLFYQPKISLITGEVVGAEALVRWDDPESEIIPPNVFLPLAEKSGLLQEISLRLLDLVIVDIASIRSVKSGLSISMNVAPTDLQSHTLSRHIEQYLHKGLVQANELQIEITESAVMGNFERIRDNVYALSELGIQVLMDDFGTGYSSIDRLSQLPFSALKLDQGVVQRMGTSRQNLNVVKASLSMARELSMTSIAEGVESAATYHFLMANGCSEAQGFHICAPLSLAEFKQFVAKKHNFDGSHLGCVHQAILNAHYFRKCLLDLVFCTRHGADGCLPSIIDPDVHRNVKEARIGKWYFGLGRQLQGIVEYNKLEPAILELHNLGASTLRLVQSGVFDYENIIAQLNLKTDNLVVLLEKLESTLLLRENIS